MEGSVTVSCSLSKEAAKTLAGDIDPGDIFISFLESLSDALIGDQVIAQKLILLSLTAPITHQRHLISICLLLSFKDIETLGQIFSRYPGMDCIEIRVRNTDMGDVMRMEIPTHDGRNVSSFDGAQRFYRSKADTQIV